MNDPACTMTCFTHLIDPTELLALMASDAPLVVLDCSFDLADGEAGERSYREGHVPGARHVHLDRDLCGARTGRNGRHPLPDRHVFAASVGAWGITPQTQVVAVDRQQAMYAARLWWMLRWLGHQAVAVLDGGLPAWQAAGGTLESSPSAAAPQPPYPAREPLATTIDADTLARGLGRIGLIDARAPERFRGEIEPLDARAGHIPGAVNRFFKDNLADDGRFKTPAQLHAEFAPMLQGHPDAPVVQQCGSGVTACHNLFALELSGWGGSMLYPGSWSEWSCDPARPVATG
jgi:thiosulfate/3-mercaptopyruvate sulfurtransferase